MFSEAGNHKPYVQDTVVHFDERNSAGFLEDFLQEKFEIWPKIQRKLRFLDAVCGEEPNEIEIV